MFRNLAYWTKDLLQGRRVRRHLVELDRAFTDPDSMQQQAQERCDRLLEFACSTTKYYAQFQGARTLEDFPVLDKQTISERQEDFFSSAYDWDRLIPISTSGSYGTPSTFYHTRDKKARQQAEVIFFSSWAGYHIGDRYAYVRIPATRNRMSLFMLNQVPIEPSILSLEWLEEQRHKLRDKSIRVLIGYASVLGALAEYCGSRGDEPNSFGLRAAIPIAEALADGHRHAMKRVFGCAVVSRYSNMESGVLANQCLCEAEHHLNEASYVIEVLSLSSERPARPRELGRVVVTDLFSQGMPLIRYDTGDLALLGQACACGRPGATFSRIEGRRVEVLTRPDGQPVPPFAINEVMRSIRGLVQYQFAQVDEGSYEMRIQALDSFDQAEAIRCRFQEVLGTGARISMIYVEQIPPLPSGKRPTIVNEFRGSAR